MFSLMHVMAQPFSSKVCLLMLNIELLEIEEKTLYIITYKLIIRDASLEFDNFPRINSQINLYHILTLALHDPLKAGGEKFRFSFSMNMGAFFFF